MAGPLELIGQGLGAVGGAARGAARALFPGAATNADLARDRQLLADAGGLETEAGRQLAAEIVKKYKGQQFTTEQFAPQMTPYQQGQLGMAQENALWSRKMDLAGAKPTTAYGQGELSQITGTEPSQFEPLPSPQDLAQQQMERERIEISKRQPGYQIGTYASELKPGTPEWKEAMKLGGSSTSINIDNRPMTEGMVQRQAQREAFVKIGEDVLKMWTPKYTGPIQGRILAAKNKWIGGDPTGAAFQAGVTSMLEQMYMRAGKQLSDVEIAKWQPFLPTVKEPDTTFLAKMNNLINNVATYLSTESEVAGRAGYRTGELEKQETVTDGSGLKWRNLGNGQWEQVQ